MKQGIHPEYKLATVHCACGNTFRTRSTSEDIHLDVCSVCHPYFTGRQRLMDTAGRVERFRRKWAKTEEGQGTKAEAPAPSAKSGGKKAKQDRKQEAAADATAEAGAGKEPKATVRADTAAELEAAGPVEEAEPESAAAETGAEAPEAESVEQEKES